MRTLRRMHTCEGAVLPFVAIVLIAIVTFFGFVLDINMLASSREQAQHFARFAALTALEQFHDPRLRCHTSTRAKVDISDPDATPCTMCEKYNFAIERVNALIPGNQTVTKKEDIPVVHGYSDSASNCSLTPGSGDETVLVPGEMVADDSGGDTPCSDSGRRSPCFIEVEVQNGDPAPSAFGIRGKYYTGLSTLWSSKTMDGAADETQNLRVDAIATLIPRRGCFLVDISASSVRDTHIRQNINRGEYRDYLRDGVDPAQIDPWGNEFAYFLGCPEVNPGADLADQADDYLTGTGFNCRTHDEDLIQPDYTTLGDTRFVGANNLTSANYNHTFANPSGLLWSNHDRTWEWLNLEHPFPTGMPERDEIHHFRDSYVLKHVYGDADYDPTLHPFNPDPTAEPAYTTNFPDGAWFNVDMGMFDRTGVGGHAAVTTSNGAGGDYVGPEPLHSILAGIRTAIQRFETRQVAGDMACVIFYDKSLTWPRVFNITDNFAALQEIFNFDNANTASLTEDLAADILTAPAGSVSGFEAIVRHGLFPRNPDNSFTNSVAAVGEALSQLDAARQASGVESADFIVNISDGLTNCVTCTGDITLAGCTLGTCSNEYSFYQQSMSDLRSSIEGIWADPAVRNIPLHVFMIGSSVAPHSLDIEEPDSEPGNENCYPYHKVGGSGFSPVRGNDTNNDGYVDDFIDASAGSPFYQANVDWFEIAKLTRGIWAPIRPQHRSDGTCEPLTLDADGDPCDPATYGIGIGTTDRREVDPFCRTKDQQIIDYVDRILGDNPFQLVEPQWPTP